MLLTRSFERTLSWVSAPCLSLTSDLSRPATDRVVRASSGCLFSWALPMSSHFCLELVYDCLVLSATFLVCMHLGPRCACTVRLLPPVLEAAGGFLWARRMARLPRLVLVSDWPCLVHSRIIWVLLISPLCSDGKLRLLTSGSCWFATDRAVGPSSIHLYPTTCRSPSVSGPSPVGE